MPLAQSPQDYPGGFAELLEVGVFSPVVKCDVESLYPSIMLAGHHVGERHAWRLSADVTRADATSPARQGTSRETPGEDRAVWEGLQSSFKVLINSFYGYLGFGAGLFNDYDAARRVTLAGQRIIKQTRHRSPGLGALPIEVDTDGVYFVPPAAVRTEEDERGLSIRSPHNFPIGIRLGHDGRYRAMLSLRMKTYGFSYDGKMP